MLPMFGQWSPKEVVREDTNHGRSDHCVKSESYRNEAVIRVMVNIIRFINCMISFKIKLLTDSKKRKGKHFNSGQPYLRRYPDQIVIYY
jgi:hypothetical protein